MAHDVFPGILADTSMDPINKHHILLLGPSLGAVSGVSTHLNLLLQSRLGEDFRLGHFQVGSEGRDETAAIKVFRLFSSPFLFCRELIRSQVEVVHLNTSLNPKAFWRDVVYLLIAKALKKRVVFQVHGGKLPEDFFAGNGILTLFLKWILRKSDAVVLLAEIEKEAYSRFVALERVLLIPNAVDLRYFENCPEKTFPNKQISAVYIGRLTRDKGVHEILDALDMLVNEEMIETVRVTLAGSGPDEPSLKRLVADRGLEPFVTFAGPVFDELKQAFWEEAELFLFPTYHEGLPYAVLESLASGTPVVTTAVGGIPDVVEEGRHGVFVPLRDAKALAEAIKEMIGDRERMRQMSAACRARAEEMYSLDRLSGQFSRLYTEIIG